MRMLRGLIFLGIFGVLQLFGATHYPHEIYENVIVKDAKDALQNAHLMVNALEKKEKTKEQFQLLALSWKKVQTLYIAGELDGSVVDLPYEIDIYHNAKENIYTQLDRIITSKEAPQKVLFKNSHKTLNALEYLIYKNNVISQREIDLALVVAKQIAKNLQKIITVYEKEKVSILADEKKFNALLINQLSASSYELKEWRAGEATGLSKKYKNNPDKKRGELYLSGLSLHSIIAILQTHEQVMDSPKYLDFGDLSIEYGAKNDVLLIRKAIQEGLKTAQMMGGNLLDSKGKLLYGNLGKLHNGYYVSLVSSLRMTSKILDADGD